MKLFYCQINTLIDALGLSYFVSVHSGDGVQVSGVRDPAMDDQHFVVNQGSQRQPAENLLEQL